jgi:sugar transferase (PEP-CTERM/EpsH1 system associated)
MAGDRDRETAAKQPPLIAHVIHHLVIGGLENGLVNLINRIPPHRYRHAIVCMTDYSDFSLRIRRDDVQIFSMHKKFGRDFGVYGKLYKLFRRIRPDVVHSRNLTALDSLLPATLSGVPVRIHGEHGRDQFDTEGKNSKYRWLRRLHRPMVSHYVALSKDLERYLREAIGVPQERITQIYNGVDIDLFHPSPAGREAIGPYSDPGHFVVGTVGRMQPVKDQLTLVRAMIELWRSDQSARERLRLALVGDGPLRAEIEGLLRRENSTDYTWLAGARDDVPRIMRGFDLFVLPSLAEGVSNTLLEAMASGLPVVATRVGGNPELMEEGRSGMLAPPADPHAMAAAIHEYYLNRDMARRQGALAREIARRRFGLDVMVANYLNLYDRVSGGNRHPRPSFAVGKEATGRDDQPVLPFDGEGQRKGR